MKKNLDKLEERIRQYWKMEFSTTRFPTRMFDAYRMLVCGQARGLTPSALAHLLHSYVTHLKEIRKR